MAQSRESTSSASSTPNACASRSEQLGSEQERAADPYNSMSSRLQDVSSDSIEPPVQLKKRVSLLGAMCSCPQILTSCDADHLELEGGHELPHQLDEGVARHVPQQGAVAERQACIDLGPGRTGENDGLTVVEPWIELKRAAIATYASSACSACGPDREEST